MHTSSAVLCSLLAAALCASPLARAADAPAPSRAALTKLVTQDAAYYQNLQFDPSTIVPNWIVAHAKGVLIIERSSTASSPGQAIGLLKGPGNKFSAPAFYQFGSAASGLPSSSTGTHLVVFLMTDDAVRSLTGQQFAWNDHLHAVAGDPNSTAAPAGALPDVILFQENSATEPAKLLAGLAISANNPDNAVFYEQSGLTAADIFSGKVDVPSAAAPLVDAINQQAAMPN